MATKFISNSGSNSNNGDTAGTPYQTTAHAIGILSNGDTISLERGSTFPPLDYQTKRIYITAHGTGAMPEISGFVLTSGWVNEGSGIWSYTDAGLPTIVNVVSVNGVFQPRVRFSKNGYSTITARTGTNYGTVTVPSIPDSPSRVGAELVLHLTRWNISRALVTGHTTGGVLTYANLNSSHNLSTLYPAKVGYGVFIQNHTSVMTEVGDWKYDNTAKKISMYFGAGNPSSYIIKVSKVARAFHTGDNGGNVTYSDIHVTGFNQFGWSSIAASTLLQGVKFSFIGEAGVYSTNVNSINHSNCTFEDMPNNAIVGESGCNDWSVSSCTFKRVYHWHGAGGSGDTKGYAVVVLGDNLNCQQNVGTNLGYSGFYFRGSGCTIQKNRFNTFCYVKDDGAAIYTFAQTRITNAVRRMLSDNIIENGIGTILGTDETELKAMGIYIDEMASEIDVKRNTITTCNKGIFAHNGHNVTIDDSNRIYKNLEQIKVRTYSTSDPSSGFVISNNVLLGDRLIVHDSAAGSNSAWLTTATGNKYFSLVTTPFTTRIDEGAFVEQNLAGWKAATGKDANATLSGYTGESLVYNATNAAADVAISGSHIDVNGTIHTGSINLGAYQGAVLFAAGAVTKKRLTVGGKRLTFGGKGITR